MAWHGPGMGYGARLPSAVLDALPAGCDESVKMARQKLTDAVADFNGKVETNPTANVAKPRSNPEHTSPINNEEIARTMCRPQESEGDCPIDFNSVQLPSEVLELQDFESSKTRLALGAYVGFRPDGCSFWAERLRLLTQCNPVLNPKLRVSITDSYEVWMVNPTDETVTVSHGELFGFGLGNAAEAPTGMASAPATFVSSTGLALSQADKAIPFLVNDDLQLVALVESQTKTLMSIADVVCSVCRTTGATALNIIDHDLQQKEIHVI